MTHEEELLLSFMGAPNISANGKAMILETYISRYGPLSDEMGDKVKKLLETSKEQENDNTTKA